MVHAMDIEGARRRSHEPTAVPRRLELGLGWPESTHRWTGRRRAASLDCSEGSKERDAGRARLDRVEGGDLWRTGPSRTTVPDVPLEVGHSNGVFPVTAQTLLRAERDCDRDPISRNGFHDYI
jgi:hypothetical protein